MNHAQTTPASAGTTTGDAMALSGVEPEPGSMLDLVLTSLDEDQAQEVVTIPLQGKSSMADYMVIASAVRPGKSPRLPRNLPNA